jgi:hypothetical protein
MRGAQSSERAARLKHAKRAVDTSGASAVAAGIIEARPKVFDAFVHEPTQLVGGICVRLDRGGAIGVEASDFTTPGLQQGAAWQARFSAGHDVMASAGFCNMLARRRSMLS